MKWYRVIYLDGCCIWRKPITFQYSPKSIPIGVDITGDEGLWLLLTLKPDRPVLCCRLCPSVPVRVIIGHSVFHKPRALQLFPANTVTHHSVFGPNCLYKEVELSTIWLRAVNNISILGAGVKVQGARPGSKEWTYKTIQHSDRRRSDITLKGHETLSRIYICEHCWYKMDDWEEGHFIIHLPRTALYYGSAVKEEDTSTVWQRP